MSCCCAPTSYSLADALALAEPWGEAKALWRPGRGLGSLPHAHMAVAGPGQNIAATWQMTVEVPVWSATHIIAAELKVTIPGLASESDTCRMSEKEAESFSKAHARVHTPLGRGWRR